MPPTIRQPTMEHALSERFGFLIFRQGQRELIEAVLAGRDALGVLPTGGGKSLTYQLPATLLQGLTIVVSPLIALMKDQVDAFNRRGHALAVALHSNLSPGEAGAAFAKAQSGKAALLYIAPERLELPTHRERILALQPKLFVIDEAHCVSQWGYDFRPSYMALKETAARFRPCPILALTATATPAVRQDIVDRLGLNNPLVVVAPFDRPNLRFEVHPCGPGEKPRRLRKILKDLRGQGSQIVYVGRRRDAEEIAEDLSGEGIKSVAYHAGLAASQRKAAQEQWLSGETPVAVATLAFGMGIDKPDVRAVVHYQHPASLEAYYQEAGRAGRDGKPARCITLFSAKDISLAHYFIRNRYPEREQIVELLEAIPPVGVSLENLALAKGDMTDEQLNVAMLTLLEQKKVLKDANGKIQCAKAPLNFVMDTIKTRKNGDYRRLETVIAYCNDRACHRAGLLRYFGDHLPAKYTCGNCSACSGGTEQVGKAAVEDEARRIFRMHQSIVDPNGTMAPRILARFLSGSASKRIPEQWRGLSGYGALSHVAMEELDRVAERILLEEMTQVTAACMQPDAIDNVPPASRPPVPMEKPIERSGGRDARSTNGLSIYGCPPVQDNFRPAISLASAEGLPDSTIFWRSKDRAFTVGVLIGRKVERHTGYLIMRLIAENEGRLAPSSVATVLRGGALRQQTLTPELKDLPQWGALGSITYDELLADVLAMHAKGYLCCTIENKKWLALSNKGRAALGFLNPRRNT